MGKFYGDKPVERISDKDGVTQVKKTGLTEDQAKNFIDA